MTIQKFLGILLVRFVNPSIPETHDSQRLQILKPQDLVHLEELLRWGRRLWRVTVWLFIIQGSLNYPTGGIKQCKSMVIFEGFPFLKCIVRGGNVMTTVIYSWNVAECCKLLWRIFNLVRIAMSRWAAGMTIFQTNEQGGWVLLSQIWFSFRSFCWFFGFS